MISEHGWMYIQILCPEVFRVSISKQFCIHLIMNMIRGHSILKTRQLTSKHGWMYIQKFYVQRYFTYLLQNNSHTLGIVNMNKRHGTLKIRQMISEHGWEYTQILCPDVLPASTSEQLRIFSNERIMVNYNT